MTQQMTWAAGKPGIEDVLLSMQADSLAYSGQLLKADENARLAVASTMRADEKETAATYQAEAGLRKALFGNGAAARQQSAAALGMSNGRDVQFLAALAVAIARDAGKAQSLTNDLAKRFPEDTLVKFNYLPTLRAQLALLHNDATKAIAELQAASPYELGQASGGGTVGIGLYPVYVRAEASRAAKDGRQAAAEYQKILDHRGGAIRADRGSGASWIGPRLRAARRDSKSACCPSEFSLLMERSRPGYSHPRCSKV